MARDIGDWVTENRRRLDNIQGTLDALDSEDTEDINFGEQRFSLRTVMALSAYDSEERTEESQFYEEQLNNNLKGTYHARDLLLSMLLGEHAEELSEQMLGTGEVDTSRRDTEAIAELASLLEEHEIEREGDTIRITSTGITDNNELEEIEELTEVAVATDAENLLQYDSINVDTKDILEER